MAPSMSTVHSNPLNILDFVVNKGHGVKGLAELGLDTLPHQYIQPPQERFDTSTEDPHNESIPVIDMSNSDDPKVVEAVCEAARKWGFFQIINHGVPIHVLEDVKDATHRFYALPAEEKNKYSKERSVTNSVRFGTSFTPEAEKALPLPAEEKNKYSKERSVTNSVRFGTSFTPEAEKALEWKDFLSLFFVSDDEAASLWPPVCRNQALEYMKCSEVVVKKLLEILMKGLNVNEIDESKESILMGSKRINLNYYPICPNPELTVGVGRHSDVSTLTILLQDNIGGLYVRNTDTMKWIHVPPVSGSLVINVGDALQIISNGKYKSIEHRVIANGTSNRISVPIFVNPRPSDVIGPLSDVLQSGEKSLYKHVLYSDYVKHFFRKAHDGKATVEFAKVII